MNDFPYAETDWTTYNGHPASRLCYQESTAGPMTAARVTRDGNEVVSPDFDVERVYRQYMTRVQHAIETDEILGARETAADHAAWYDQDH